ncbi:SDR family NAD(P)-dependent oxidoreductase [Pseudonocardia spinosispora]|uniref:SDR family NAD(P)-dependent oxidoreductase n=1 Tax=Pseudonocardia spinosispora TaxID=103441 RepID=UPI00041D606B|nr:SDR family oxidoreductase [Pseudonocardia spinosispora]
MLSISLSGVRALVTGGAAGIGAGCVSALQQAGAFVVSLDLVEPATARPDRVVTGDVTDPAVRAHALDTLGTDGPVLLVNNAALQLELRLAETTDEQIARLLSVNVAAAASLTRDFAARAATGSSIVNMASVLGVTGDPALAAYTLTKAAIVNLTRTTALEYAGRIRVNAVLPGAIRTPLTTRAWDASPDPEQARRRQTALYPAGRVGEPEDVGPVVAFLASPLAGFMTGALVAVDGGLSAANAEWALERL